MEQQYHRPNEYGTERCNRTGAAASTIAGCGNYEKLLRIPVGVATIAMGSVGIRVGKVTDPREAGALDVVSAEVGIRVGKVTDPRGWRDPVRGSVGMSAPRGLARLPEMRMEPCVTTEG